MNDEDRRRQEIAGMMRDLENPRRLLSRWEQDFLYSLTDREPWRTFTDKQYENLKKVWEEKANRDGR